MKRIILTITLAATFILLFCIATANAAYATGTYIVAQAKVGVYSTPDSSATLLCELYGGASANIVTVTEIQNGQGKVYIASEAVSGWVEMTALEYIGGQSGSDITGITVTAPAKLSYIDGEEEFNAAGLRVYAVRKNGTKSEVNGYELFVPSLRGIGTKTAYVYYSPDNSDSVYSAKFSVTVNRVPVSGVKITINPDKTSYIQNEMLSLSGLQVTVTFSDGRPNKTFTTAELLKDSDFVLTSCHGETGGKVLAVGTHKIRITYKYSDIYTELPITVRERKLVSLSVVRQPDVAAYYVGEGLIIEGLELSAKYDNTETQEVQLSDCNIEFDSAAAVIGSTSTVKIKYYTQSVTLKISVRLNELIGVKLTPPTKTEYVCGEALDTNGLVLTGIYNSGVQRQLSDYTLSVTKMTVPGKYTVFVSCGEYSAPFTVTVSNGRLLGDSDGDGVVSASDARTTLRLAVKLDKVSDSTQFSVCDVDGDKTITAADARLVLRASVKLEELGWLK